MSLLMVHEQVDFNSLKELLRDSAQEPISDGNLASHIHSMEKKGLLTVSKEFVGRKPRTSYQATAEGRKAFEAHLNALEELIRSMGG
ncbi:MAG: transcriptional regulator [Bacteroidetes bacterium]|nr:MAG: transcriptional regulator [Bacteroidota bacterium]